MSERNWGRRGAQSALDVNQLLSVCRRHQTLEIVTEPFRAGNRGLVLDQVDDSGYLSHQRVGLAFADDVVRIVQRAHRLDHNLDRTGQFDEEVGVVR